MMLGVTADGRKLPAMVIFKRKTIPKIRVPPGVIIRAHEKGRMDGKLVDDWVNNVLLPFIKPPRGIRWSKTLLVLDSYRGHITDGVLAKLRWHRVIPAIIPGGCTPLLQPLDVSINRSFKAGLRTFYNDWFADEGVNSFTTAGNLKSPPAETVLKWIAQSWSDVPEHIIVKAFLTTGISNAVDGSQDHLVLAHMRDAGQVEVGEDVHSSPLVDEWVNPLYTTTDDDEEAAREADDEDCGDMPAEEEEAEEEEEEEEEEEAEMEAEEKEEIEGEAEWGDVEEDEVK
ncbi:unnamed protein product [Closterium sp. NIES-54]